MENFELTIYVRRDGRIMAVVGFAGSIVKMAVVRSGAGGIKMLAIISAGSFPDCEQHLPSVVVHPP